MANLLGEPFDEYVSRQINTRQRVHGKINNRTIDEITYLNSRNAWTKLASGVWLEPERIDLLINKGNSLVEENDTGPTLAAKNVLFNGLSSHPTEGMSNLLKDDEGNTTSGTYLLDQRAGIRNPYQENVTKKAYGVGGTDFGPSPMPGITDVSIKDLNRGSLKTADITIIANNRNQFDVIDVLYMRLGMSVFLEWGYDKYLDNRGILINQSTTLIEDEWFDYGNKVYTDWLPLIAAKRRETNGNYDGIFGTVTNFSWTFEPDGSYKIKLKVMSLGDVIESLKLNLPPLQVKLDPNIVAQKANRKATFSTEVAGNLSQFYELYPSLRKQINNIYEQCLVSDDLIFGNIQIHSDTNEIGIQYEIDGNYGGIDQSPYTLVNRVPLVVPGSLTLSNFGKELFESTETDSAAKANINTHLTDAVRFAIFACTEGTVGGDLYTNVTAKYKDSSSFAWLESFNQEPYRYEPFYATEKIEKVVSYPFEDIKRVNYGNIEYKPATPIPINANKKNGEVIFPSKKAIPFTHPWLLGPKKRNNRKGKQVTAEKWKYKNRTAALTALMYFTLSSVYAKKNSNGDYINVNKGWEKRFYRDENNQKVYYYGAFGSNPRTPREIGQVILNTIFMNIPQSTFEDAIFQYFKLKGVAGSEDDPQFSEQEYDTPEEEIEANQDIDRIHKYFYKLREYGKKYSHSEKIYINKGGPTVEKDTENPIGVVINPTNGNNLQNWTKNPSLYPSYTSNEDHRDIIRLNIQNPDYSHFIRFGTFLDFLQDRVIPNVISGNRAASLINIDTKRDGNICYYIDNVMSSDIRKCIISNYQFHNKQGNNEKIFEGLEYFKGPKSKYAYGRIMNIYFNFKRIEEIFSKKDSRGEVNLFTVLKTMCDDINSCLGNINNIEPVINKETNTITFIDQTPIPFIDEIAAELEDYKGRASIESTLEVLGYNKDNKESNFVRKVGITTKIDKNYATMITIGATANGSIPGIETTAFSKWNVGIKDRFKEEIVDSTNSSKDLPTQNAGIIANYKVFLDSSKNSKVLQKLGLNTSYKISEPYIKTNTATISNYYKYAQAQTSLDTGGIESSVGFLPFDLKLTLDGISGMKIYNRVKINSSFLPSNYPETLKFIVTGVNHKISDNDWVTDISTLATSNLQQDKKSQVINTPNLINGVTSSIKPNKVEYIDNTVEEGNSILTQPSGFKLLKKAYGGNRPESQVKQIYLHHTAGHQRTDKGKGTVNTFNQRANDGSYGSTNSVIDANGHLETLVPYDKYAYGQGVKGAWAKYKVNYNTLGVSTEIMALGYFTKLTSDKQKWTRKDGVTIPLDEAVESYTYDEKPYFYKFKRYQKYTPAQIQSTVDWVAFCLERFNIEWHFDQAAYNEMFPRYKSSTDYDLSPGATGGKSGVFTHNSVNPGKSDIFPQLELIQAFKSAFPPPIT